MTKTEINQMLYNLRECEVHPHSYVDLHISCIVKELAKQCDSGCNVQESFTGDVTLQFLDNKKRVCGELSVKKVENNGEWMVIVE